MGQGRAEPRATRPLAAPGRVPLPSVIKRFQLMRADTVGHAHGAVKSVRGKQGRGHRRGAEVSGKEQIQSSYCTG
jgi:hypothetical protein